MVNPQLENGHIDIANEIAEALAGARISGEEVQILWVILRKTWGWHKKEDMISLSQFNLLTKMSKPSINRSLKKLLTKKIILVDKNVNPMQPNTYSFNKHYDEWNLLTKKITVLKTIDKNVNPTIDKNVTHKRKSTTKENKEIYKERFSGYSKEFNVTFEEFIKMRKLIKKPMTNKAIELALKKLETLSTTEAGKIAILNQSIENSWQGLFEIKVDRQAAPEVSNPAYRKFDD